MSYEANVLNVMIASPSDVGSERTIIRDVIYEWNAVHSEVRKLVLMPVGWESHSSPEMGRAPQDIINEQVLNRCDILIGVFWTRIGTKTRDYASGTVEEIEEHIDTGKPAMLYFSSQPVALDSVDPEQISLLKAFKLSCEKRGLYESYDNLSQFKEKLYRQLQLKLNAPAFQSSKDNSQVQSPVESKTPLPQLSAESRTLLKEASLDKYGTIVVIRHLAGTNIQTNEKNFTASNERREIARWESALQELLTKSLIVERGHKGEIFELSNLGYQIADMIEL